MENIRTRLVASVAPLWPCVPRTDWQAVRKLPFESLYLALVIVVGGIFVSAGALIGVYTLGQRVLGTSHVAGIVIWGIIISVCTIAIKETPV
jgi:hypothetical protein